ncbi:MAG: hypothetical protein H6557_28820 [Lewinellaceae bacterium]|nr:hypothetical protein [Lewinellaceae bacterium]
MPHPEVYGFQKNGYAVKAGAGMNAKLFIKGGVFDQPVLGADPDRPIIATANSVEVGFDILRYRSPYRNK